MELRSSSFTLFPYDILREIIIYDSVYTMETDEYYEPLLHFQVVSPPIVASHVCRSWRLSLLSDSTLWTCLSIPDMKPSGIMELLRRSNTSLLNVFLILKPSRKMEYYDMLSSLFEQMCRFKILYIRMQATPWRWYKFDPLYELFDHVFAYLLRPAPRLQMFFLLYLDSCLELGDTYLDPLFSGIAPNLKHVYHILSPDLGEISQPLFHDLFELHLYLPKCTLNFDRFFDFLELSPRLKLLHINADWHTPDFASVPVEYPSNRKVNFPNFKGLVLEVANSMVELMGLILETVTSPQDPKWQITVQPYQLENSSPVRQYLSRARFTSLTIWFADSDAIQLLLEEDFASNYINQFDGSTLRCILEDVWKLIDLWNPLMRYIESSYITHLSLNVGSKRLGKSELFGCQLFPTIVASMPMRNLESLAIKYEYTLTSYNDGPSLSFLSELLPNLEKITASEYNTSTTMAGDINPIQDLDLDLISIDSEEDLPSPDIDVITSSITSAIPFPRLHELHVELEAPLKVVDAIMLRTCSSLRQEEGYPLKVSVRCGEMKEGVEFILQSQDTGDIHVSVSPPP